jgi:hypothetical protein
LAGRTDADSHRDGARRIDLCATAPGWVGAGVVVPDLAQWHGFCNMTGENLSSHLPAIAGVAFMNLRHTTDCKIGATYTIEGFVLGGDFVGARRDHSNGVAGARGKNMSDNTFVVLVSKTF